MAQGLRLECRCMCWIPVIQLFLWEAITTVHTTSCEPLNATSPTINTLAFGFHILWILTIRRRSTHPNIQSQSNRAWTSCYPTLKLAISSYHWLLLTEAVCSHNKLQMALLKRDRVLSFHCVALFSLLQGQNQ